MKIPKIAHRIWFGEPFPEKYTVYLRTLAQLNPDYQIKLWSDPETVSSASYNQLKQFCENNNIELCNIREQPSLVNHDLIMQELNASKKTQTHRKLHYTRAADIARIAILIAQGGVYNDTDSEPIAMLPELDAKHGVLLKWFGHAEDDICFNFFEPQFPVGHCQYFFGSFIVCVENLKFTQKNVVTC